jgi:hypothetical protein
LPAQVLFPWQRLLFFPMYGEAIVALPRHDNLAKPSRMPSFSQCLRDKRSVHGERKLGHINPFAMQCRLHTCEQENEDVSFVRMITTLLRAKQQMQRECPMIDGSHHTE